MDFDTSANPSQADELSVHQIARSFAPHSRKFAAAPAARMYALAIDGVVIVERSANPEFDACRVLAAKGVTGTLITRWGNATTTRYGQHRKGAGLTASDPDKGRLAITNWSPSPEITSETEDTEPTPLE